MSRAKDVRLFDTFETTKSAVPKSQPQAFATGSSKWDFMFRAATTAQSLAIERLVVSTLCPTSASSQHGAALEADPFATALRDHLVPTWRRLPWAASFMARRYRAAIESSLFGVPGLVNYVQTRRQWIDAHIASAAREGASQVLIIGAGFDTRSLRLAAGLPSLTVCTERKDTDFIYKTCTPIPHL
jgi:O-methyltransferase involved in polyketide biosynthesis